MAVVRLIKPAPALPRFPHLYTSQELVDLEIKHLWLMEDLLPVGGRLLIHGKQGIGKSFLGLRMALAIASGGYLFGQWKCHPRGRSVLYVQADLPEVMWSERAKRLSQYWPWWTKAPIHHYRPSNFDIMTVEEDEEEVAALQSREPCVVIWDVLGAIEHEREEMHVPSMIYKKMETLFPSAAHILYHHDRKETEYSADLDPAEMFSGMKGWINFVVAAWHLTENKQNLGNLTLVVTKNNCGMKNQKLILKPDHDTLLPVRTADFDVVPEVIDYWRTVNNIGERLQRLERERLRQYLLASGVASTERIAHALERLT